MADINTICEESKLQHRGENNFLSRGSMSHDVKRNQVQSGKSLSDQHEQLSFRSAFTSMRNLASKLNIVQPRTPDALERQISAKELANLMKHDDILWNEFRDELVDSKVITDYGVLAYLGKFLEENNDRIKIILQEKEQITSKIKTRPMFRRRSQTGSAA